MAQKQQEEGVHHPHKKGKEGGERAPLTKRENCSERIRTPGGGGGKGGGGGGGGGGVGVTAQNAHHFPLEGISASPR